MMGTARCLEMMMVVIDTPRFLLSRAGIHPSSRILLLALALFHNVWLRQQLSSTAKHSISISTYLTYPHPHSPLRMDGVARYHKEFDSSFFLFRWQAKASYRLFSKLSWIGHNAWAQTNQALLIISI